MKQKHQEQIDDIMNNFDFEKVEKAMSLLNWEWHQDGLARVPYVFRMKQTAERMLTECVNGKFVKISTGGFKASYENDILRLSFELANSSTEVF